MPSKKPEILDSRLHKLYYSCITIRKDEINQFLEHADIKPLHLSYKLELAVTHLIGMVRGSTVSEIKHPSDWWQAFRERWLPNWWLKHYPVNYTCYQVDRHYPPAYPEGIIRVYNSKKDSGYLHA